MYGSAFDVTFNERSLESAWASALFNPGLFATLMSLNSATQTLNTHLPCLCSSSQGSQALYYLVYNNFVRAGT